MSFKTQERAIIHILEAGLLYQASLTKKHGVWIVKQVNRSAI